MLSKSLLKDSDIEASDGAEYFDLNALILVLKSSSNSEDAESFPDPKESELDNVTACLHRSLSYYHCTDLDKICAVIFNLCKGHFLNNGNKRITLLVVTILYMYMSGDEEMQEDAFSVISAAVDDVAIISRFSIVRLF